MLLLLRFLLALFVFNHARATPIDKFSTLQRRQADCSSQPSGLYLGNFQHDLVDHGDNELAVVDLYAASHYTLGDTGTFNSAPVDWQVSEH